MSENVMSIVLILVLLAIFYFLLIRPQQKRMRQQMELIRNLKVGDEVMTSAGIFGTVHQLEEDTVLLEVAEDVVIRVAKNSIVRNFTSEGSQQSQEDEGEKD
ncbi:MAG: preprotein translocase subunit YajC [Candidatus Geothermincolales bacterium]